MSFRLKEAVYKVRCRAPGCTFTSEFAIKENLMGVTEADIDTEAIKIAKNMAFIKHDALLGRKHQLANPEVFRVSGSYERIGGLTSGSVFAPAQGPTAQEPAHTFRRGGLILSKQESAALVVEVIRGSAQNAGHPGLRYRPGAMVGTATIFHQKSRPADIVAAEDNTIVTVHDVKELTRTNPARARELYDRALEDVFHVLLHLQDYSSSLEKKLKKLESLRTARKPPQRRAAAKRAAAKPAPARKKAAKPASARRKPAAKARKR